MLKNLNWEVVGLGNSHMIIKNKKDWLFYVYKIIDETEYQKILENTDAFSDEYEIAVMEGSFSWTYNQFLSTVSPDQVCDYWPLELEGLAIEQAAEEWGLYIDFLEARTEEEFEDNVLFFS